MTKLVAKIRDKVGSNGPRQLRRIGKLPAILYGYAGTKNIVLDYDDFDKKIGFPRKNIVFDLSVDGDDFKVIIKDFQYNIVKNKIEHLDFFAMNDGEIVTVKVPVKFTGIAEGIREGGSLFIIKKEVKIRCAYEKIPALIEIPIDSLKINDYRRASDIELPEGVELLENKKQTLASITGRVKVEASK